MVQFNEKKQKERIKELHKKEEEDLMKILSEKYGIPYIDLSAVSINSDALRLIQEDEARKARVAGFSISGKKVKIAIVSPQDEKVKKVEDDLIRMGYKPEFYLASKRSLSKAWSIYPEISFATETEAGVFDVSHQEIGKITEEIKNAGNLKTLIKETLTDTKRRRTSRVLEIILAGAISIGASDVHIEPGEKLIGMRFRLDGVLHDMPSFSREIYTFLLSRVKLLSGLKINIKESAQDGRFSVKLKFREIEIRTSVIPGEYGESIVMRILNTEDIDVSFENLGIEGELLKELKREIKKPNGMILTTGPTGSGKTTTLYAFLKKIHRPEIKIITIEDPIEYHIEGVTQTQANKKKGYSFAEGLRAALRQDPDIIMVGEIRDEETAETAINASLTGHLVLSTLHTNNAAGVIPRLIDLGVNQKTIGSALNIPLAQRLVRKLCSDCKEEYTPSKNEKKIIDYITATIEKKRGDIPKVNTIWKAHTDTEDTSGEKVCETCGGFGYKGRIGVFEGIVMNEDIEKVISTENPSEREIQKVTSEQKIFSMKEDGIIKVLDGTTSLEELSRVVDLND